MQAIIHLLSQRDSPAAAALQRGLQSLQISLRETVQRTPQDPGASACRRLLEELAGLLQESGQAAHTAGSPEKDSSLWNEADALIKENDNQQSQAEASFVLHPPAVWKLIRLREEIESSQQLQDRLGPFRLHSTSDAALWGEIQRLLLRLSPAEAQPWSRRVTELYRQAGSRLSAEPALALLDEVEEEIYPGLAGAIGAPGLKLSTKSALHPLVGNGPWKGDTARMAAHVSFCLHFVELDAFLHHALETVRPLGVHPLIGSHREAYTRELLGRLHRLRKAENDPLGALHAWITLDEAIQSLLYVPPAKQMSWWHQHQQRARKRLDLAAERARQAGHRVHIRWLTGSYRQVKSFSKNDWGLESSGNLGEVLVCLRVYAEIDGQTFPGRVIYRDY